MNEELNPEYRLEFSEEQQCFHMELLTIDNENTNGYMTVMNPCSEFQKNILKSFLYRNEENGINGPYKVKYRIVDVLEAVDEIKGLIKNLRAYSIIIKSN